MLSYLKYAVALATVFVSLSSHASASTIHCNQNLDACGIAFTTIPATPSSLTTTSNLTSTAYVITNTGTSSVTLNTVSLVAQGDNAAGSSAVTIGTGTGTLCAHNTVLAASGTCNIYLDFAPSSAGLLNWNLVVTPYSTQRPLSLNITTTVASAGSNYAIAGGTYQATDFNNYPLLALSSDHGSSWSYPMDNSGSNLPADINLVNTNNTFTQVGCYGNTCIAAGAYTGVTADPQLYPMIALNTGSGWSYPIDSADVPTANFGFINFRGLDCYGNTCLAAGDYNFGVSLAYASLDGGITWSLVLDSSNTTYGGLKKVACTQDYCITYDSTGDILTMATGQTSFTTAYSTGTSLTQLTCAGSYCIAMSESGGYLSSNAGATWGSLTLPTAPTNVTYLYESLGCSTTKCIIGGQYIFDDAVNPVQYYPLALTASTSDLSNWTVVVDDGSTQPSNIDNTSIHTDGATCTGSSCFIAGRYVPIGGSYEVLFLAAVTTDADYLIDNTNLPANLQEQHKVVSLSCVGSNCSLVGSYLNTGFNDILLITNSTNTGATWTYEVEDGVGLPPSFLGGNFENGRQGQP